MPKPISARRTKSTMMMIAMVSFSLTILAGFEAGTLGFKMW